MTKKLTFGTFYSATARTGTIGRRLSNHNVFLKIIDSQDFFGKRTIKIQDSTSVGNR